MSIPEPAPLDDHEYDAIEGAVVATSRGRRFLAEYARRNRQSDTTVVLAAIERLEDVLRAAPADASSTPASPFETLAMGEIAAIKADVLDTEAFGRTIKPLDSGVQAGPRATAQIIAAAERIRDVAWAMREQGLPNDICDVLDARSAEILAACSAQEAISQRNKKGADEPTPAVSGVFSDSVPRPSPPWIPQASAHPSIDAAPAEPPAIEDDALSIDDIVAATEEISVADSLATLPAIPLSIELRIEPAKPAPDVTRLVDAFARAPDRGLLDTEPNEVSAGGRATPLPEAPLPIRSQALVKPAPLAAELIRSGDEAAPLRTAMPPAPTLPSLTFPSEPVSAESLKLDAPEPDAHLPAANDALPTAAPARAPIRYEPLAIISALSAEEKIALCS